MSERVLTNRQNTQDQRLATADETTPQTVSRVRCIRWLCDWRMEMCDELKIGTQWFDRIGDVRAALPGVEIIKSRHYEKMPPDEACLCGVDICATLVQAGYDYDHEPGSGRWVVLTT